MIYGSVCSGIEAATIAWHPLGWKPAFFSEIEKFPSAVLAHHYPTVPLHGDFTTINGDEYGAIDLLVGGTPCQDFSVAGLRAGITGERGSLTLEFIRLVERTRPRWVVWENVPGVLSLERGRTFAGFLYGLRHCGYGFAYRILDAQYFGVPQRRRRVFVVGYFGDWRPAAAVLFECESLCRNITPRRKKGKEIASFAPSSFGGYSEGGSATLRASGGGVGGGSEALVAGIPETAGCLQERDAKGADSDTKPGHLIPVAFNARQDPVHGAITGALDQFGNTQCIAFAQNQLGEVREGEVFNTLNTNSNASGRNTPLLNKGIAVRRLTPRECERLQGFPDDYTLVPFHGKPAADGSRYKALGNSMHTGTMRWLGDRIQEIENKINS